MLDGGAEEFRELVVRHQAAVFRLSLRILGRREDAEDAAQEAFIKAYSNLASYRERGKFAQWLRTIAINTCLNRLPREVPVDLPESIEDGAISPEAEALRRIDCEEVWRAVGSLSPAYRAVLALRYAEDMSYKEIAEALGEPTSTIQVRLHRAKKALASVIAGSVTNEV